MSEFTSVLQQYHYFRKRAEELAKDPEQLSTINDIIAEMENHPTLHIEEQSAKMADDFFEFVKAYFIYLVYSSPTVFHVQNTDPHHLLYTDGYPAPISITYSMPDCPNKYIIISEDSDRYFMSEPRVRYSPESIDLPYVTQWYSEYLKDFFSALKRNLMSRNPLKDIFDIKFDGSTFTLECIYP